MAQCSCVLALTPVSGIWTPFPVLHGFIVCFADASSLAHVFGGGMTCELLRVRSKSLLCWGFGVS